MTDTERSMITLQELLRSTSVTVDQYKEAIYFCVATDTSQVDESKKESYCDACVTALIHLMKYTAPSTDDPKAFCLDLIQLQLTLHLTLLKKLYRNGLLQNEVQKPTFLHDEPGTALFLFPCPIGHSFLPILFYKLLQWLWFPLLVLTAVVVTINGGLSSLPPLSGYSALLPPAALLFNIVLHELSHAWAGSSFGIPADAFGVGVYRFLPFGAAFFSLLPYATVSADVGISVAGPLANLFAGSVALLLAISSQSSDSLYLAVCSYTLGCINLLPIPGFDGVSLHDMFPHQLKIGFGTVLCGLAANWAVLAVGYALCFLPWWVSFLIVLVLTVMAALLLPSRHSVCWARMLSTFCLLPVMIKSLGFELLAVSLPTAILNIGFCLLLSYLTAPVLLELIFVSYLYQK